MTILALIATFTIPKILAAQQNGSKNAKAKEVAGVITQAALVYQQKVGAFSGTMTGEVIAPYLNYVSIDTTSNFDDPVFTGGGAATCNNGLYSGCYKLHNGAYLVFWREDFNTTGNAVFIGIDPDGRYTGGSNDKALWFLLHINGRLETWGTAWNDPANDPDWFSW